MLCSLNDCIQAISSHDSRFELSGHISLIKILPCMTKKLKDDLHQINLHFPKPSFFVLAHGSPFVGNQEFLRRISGIAWLIQTKKYFFPLAAYMRYKNVHFSSQFLRWWLG